MALKPIIRENYRIFFPEEQEVSDSKKLRHNTERALNYNLRGYVSFDYRESVTKELPKAKKRFNSRNGDVLSIKAKLKIYSVSENQKYTGLNVLFEYLKGTPEKDLNIIRNILIESGLEKFIWDSSEE